MSGARWLWLSLAVLAADRATKFAIERYTNGPCAVLLAGYVGEYSVYAVTCTRRLTGDTLNLIPLACRSCYDFSAPLRKSNRHSAAKTTPAETPTTMSKETVSP